MEREILGLREQLNSAAETLVLKDEQLNKLDNYYCALCRSERYVAQNLAQEQKADEGTKQDPNALELLMRELAGLLLGEDVSSRRDSARGRRELMS